MAFLRTKRVTKGGKTYVYEVWQASVRVGGKVKSIYLGKADEHAHVPALLEQEHLYEKAAPTKESGQTSKPAVEPPLSTEATAEADEGQSPGGHQ